jgi:GT2 family glycosyltransferase
LSDERGTLDVAIVSYRCKERLHDCLASLQRHPPSAAAMTVRVVDNGSGDGTLDMLAREFPDVSVIANADNRGFAAASNQAITAGRAPVVLVINPDTRLEAGTIDTLLAVMDAEPRVGIAGPALLTEDGSPDHAAARSFPTPLSSLGHFTGLGRRPRAPDALRSYARDPAAAGPVDAVNGAFMLIRRAALDQVGDFDEGYWMYMEDLDLCWRFGEAGWLTWYEPSVSAFHLKGGSAGPVRSLRLDYAFHYGMYRFYRRHYAPSRNPLLNVVVFAGILTHLGISVARTGLVRTFSPQDDGGREGKEAEITGQG